MPQNTKKIYPLSYPLDPLLAIRYRNHQKSLAYFSHLAPLILFFFIKRQSQYAPDRSVTIFFA